MIALRVTAQDLNIGKNIRYVRDTINGSDKGVTNEWVEITLRDLYDTNILDTNVANSIKITSTGPIVDCSSLMNKDTTTNAQLSITPGAQASVVIDLGVITKIKSINIIRRYDDNRINNVVKTEISEDGHNWITIYDGSTAGLYQETPTGKTHYLLKDAVEAADWEVSEVRDFSTKLITTYNDRFYLDHVLFDIVLDKTKTYYGRVRFLLAKTGYTEWSDVTVFIPDDLVNYDRKTDAPTLVSPPIMSTNFPYNNHPGTLFNVYANGFGVESATTHISTSWYIKDIEDNILWYVNKDTVNLNLLQIDKSIITLDDNSVYKIGACFHTADGHSSTCSDITIHVNNNDRANIIRDDLSSVDSTVANTFRILNIDGLTTTTVSIKEQTTTTPALVLTLTLPTGTTDILVPANTLSASKDYILEVEPYIATGSLLKRYTYIKTL